MPRNTLDLLDQLAARGFIHQSTDLNGLRLALNQGPITFYLGFDATADSLHVGHLQALMLMRHLQRAGHKPILLIGGATTRIGDPSFRDSSRPVLTEAQIQQNIAGITGCFARYIQLGDGPEDLAGGLSLTDLLLRHELQPSRSAVRRLAAGGDLLLDGERQGNPDQPLQAWQLGRRLSLGKKRHYLLQAQ